MPAKIGPQPFVLAPDWVHQMGDAKPQLSLSLKLDSRAIAQGPTLRVVEWIGPKRVVRG